MVSSSEEECERAGMSRRSRAEREGTRADADAHRSDNFVDVTQMYVANGWSWSQYRESERAKSVSWRHFPPAS
jgi:hypothetical protein